jgi:hypothetical protein
MHYHFEQLANPELSDVARYVYATDAWLAGAAHMLYGKLKPAAVVPDWTVVGRQADLVVELDFTIGAESIRLNVFVFTPFKNDEGASLHGYRIGRYATTLIKGLDTYAVPHGFIDFAKGPGDLQISPHFTLK